VAKISDARNFFAVHHESKAAMQSFNILDGLLKVRVLIGNDAY